MFIQNLFWCFTWYPIRRSLMLWFFVKNCILQTWLIEGWGFCLIHFRGKWGGDGKKEDCYSCEKETGHPGDGNNGIWRRRRWSKVLLMLSCKLIDWVSHEWVKIMVILPNVNAIIGLCDYFLLVDWWWDTRPVTKQETSGWPRSFCFWPWLGREHIPGDPGWPHQQKSPDRTTGREFRASGSQKQWRSKEEHPCNFKCPHSPFWISGGVDQWCHFLSGPAGGSKTPVTYLDERVKAGPM